MSLDLFPISNETSVMYLGRIVERTFAAWIFARLGRAAVSGYRAIPPSFLELPKSLPFCIVLPPHDRRRAKLRECLPG